ncbi:MAG: hypothetical protein ABUL58_01830 [Steroidobacter sp.]
MKLVGVLQLAVCLAVSLLGLWLYFWLNFCFEPTPFHFPAQPGDCYFIHTSQPHIGLVFGFITSVVVAASTLVAAVGFLMSKPWARSLAVVVALGGASTFLLMGFISSGLRKQFFIVAALLAVTAIVYCLRLSPNNSFKSDAVEPRTLG